MLNERDTKVITDLLGEDFFDALQKSEIYKPNTKSVVSPDEIKVALQIVPRAILSYLFANLRHKGIGDVVDLELPFASNAHLHINKLGPDNYKGEVTQDGKRLVEFQHRSLPSIGLILLTTFELYDLSLLDEIKESKEPQQCKQEQDLQRMIDERMRLQGLVQEVVERKLSEREAIYSLVKERLNAHVLSINLAEKTGLPNNEEQESMDKKSRLKEFLESRERRRQESVDMDKSEIKCQDCSTSIYKNNDKAIKLCICYGEFMGKSIKLQKTENGQIKLKFPKSFDIDNVEMLLDTIKNK